MSLDTTQNTKQYTGNGTTKTFAFPYLFYDNADLVVTTVDIATGLTVTLALGTDYTVSGAGNGGGGSITTLASDAYTDGTRLTIQRIVSPTQPDEYYPTAAIDTESLEKELDRQVMMAQQLSSVASRSLVFPASDPVTLNSTLPIDIQRAGKILAFDQNGNPIVSDSLAVGMYRGDYATATIYNYNDTINDSGSIYIVLKQYLSVSLEADVAAGDIRLLFDASALAEAVEAAEAASTAATAAAATATAAAEGLTAFTGSVSFFCISSAPTGWLVADGSTISRTTYAALFAVIGTTFGAGDGSTTFKLPDLRGYFLRALNTFGSGVDPSRALGSVQAHAMQAHTHGYSQWQNLDNSNPGSGSPGQNPNVPATTGQNSGNSATETRPSNIALLACIKT